MFSSSDIIIFDSIAIDADIKCEFILTFILVFTLFRRSLRQKNLRAKFRRRTRFLCVLHFHDERERGEFKLVQNQNDSSSSFSRGGIGELDSPEMTTMMQSIVHR